MGAEAIGGEVRAPRPTKGYHGVRRGGALPLPRATARVAPTEGYKECLAGGRTGASAPTEGYKECGEVGDPKGRPYPIFPLYTFLPPGFLTSLTMISAPHAADLDTLLIFNIF